MPDTMIFSCRATRRSRPLGLLGAVLLLLGLQAAASAQVLVYRLEFEKAGSSINFDLYDSGFFAVEALGGSGSFVFTYRENGRDQYLRANDAGELFFAIKDDARRAVVRATADTDTALAHYLVHGQVNDSLSATVRGQKIRFRVATTLRGFVLASDSEQNATLTRADDDLGFAGTASMKALLQRGLTEAVNEEGLDPNGVIDLLVTKLEIQGYRNGAKEETEAAETDTGNDTDSGSEGAP
jgi:hypothetical protein